MPVRVIRASERHIDEVLRILPDEDAAETSGGPEPCSTATDVTATDVEVPAPPFLSLGDAADWLCVSLSTLKRLVARGELGTVLVGKRRRIPASLLAAYIAKDILLPEHE